MKAEQAETKIGTLVSMKRSFLLKIEQKALKLRKNCSLQLVCQPKIIACLG